MLSPTLHRTRVDYPFKHSLDFEIFLQGLRAIQDLRNTLMPGLDVRRVNDLSGQSPDLSSSLRRLTGKDTAGSIQGASAVVQLINLGEQLLKVSRKRRQVLESVAPGAEVSKAEIASGRADTMRSVTLRAVEARRSLSFKEMSACLEFVELVCMARAAHRENLARRGFADEAFVCAFFLLGAGIAVVAVTARQADKRVSASREQCYRFVALLLMTGDTTRRGRLSINGRDGSRIEVAQCSDCEYQRAGGQLGGSLRHRLLYLPSKCGLRFSMNARTPSRKSFEWKHSS